MSNPTAPDTKRTYAEILYAFIVWMSLVSPRPINIVANGYIAMDANKVAVKAMCMMRAVSSKSI